MVASSAFDLSKLHINTALKETPSRLLYYTSLLIKSCLYYDKKNNKKRYIITNYIITKRGRTSLTLCIQCKGRKFCARPTCSVFKRFEAHNEKKMEKIPTQSKFTQKFIQNIGKPYTSLNIKKTNIFGASPPSIFIGHTGYPRISAGPLIQTEATGSMAASYDNPARWLGKSIEEIINLRSNLIRSKININVKKPLDNRLVQKTQEIALSARPVETEILFEKPPALKLQFDDIITPIGPSGTIKKLSITENPTVPRKVDAVVSDTDMPATEAISELYTAKISQDHITRLFSSGLLGRKRGLVPTRWSITAADDTIAKQLIKKIQDHQEITAIEVHSGELLANHFEILLLPRPYAFELVEIWMPRSAWNSYNRNSYNKSEKKETFMTQWNTHEHGNVFSYHHNGKVDSPPDSSLCIEADSEDLLFKLLKQPFIREPWIGTDREDHHNRKKYSLLGGGYYAARLPILEHLQRKQRRASAVAIREVRPDYWAPLGVWVVREAARNALKNPPKTFETLNQALTHIQTKIITPRKHWQPQLQLLKEQNQRRLTDYIK